jgi:hypothetical protein
MMYATGNAIESRVVILERDDVSAAAAIADLTQRVARLEQQLWNAASQGAGGGGGGGGAFVCLPTSAVSAATWTSSAPTTGVSFTADVWSWNGTTPTFVASNTCINMLPVALVANAPCPCVPDNAGNYAVYSQSCATV